MNKKRSGGLPRDNLFRNTDAQKEPAEKSAEATAATEAVVETATVKKEKPKSRARKVNKSQGLQSDKKTPSSEEKQKTSNAPRQTYYVPANLHKQLRLLALQEEKNVSDLVVEGVEWILGKYDK